jgi:hypothetical protein
MALTVDQKRMKATKFPPEFDVPVNKKKVNMNIMKIWIATKITEILHDEDDVVIETCYELLDKDDFVSHYRGWLCIIITLTFPYSRKSRSSKSSCQVFSESIAPHSAKNSGIE